jgi:hypothetical protein
MKLLTSILLLILTVACTAEAKPGVPEAKPYLVKAEKHSKTTAEEFKQDFPVAAAYIKHGYTAYRITYNTTNTDGSDIVASGAIFIPDVKGALPMLNYNHGTYFPSRERNAPSYLSYSDELNIGKLFSSAGYLVVMPDYIGYGSTKDQAHTYGAYHFMAGTVVDMLRAV